jgi:fibronectin-binding autotransporter adhesin
VDGGDIKPASTALAETDMQGFSRRLVMAGFLVLAAAAASARAADVTKANNTDALTLGSSWVGGTAPGAGDTIVWDSTVAGANTVPQGGDLSVEGIRIENPGGLVRIEGDAAQTLTVGASGIDLSTATQNLNLAQTSTLAVRLAMGANQIWDVAGNRLITSGNTNGLGVLVANNGHTLTVDGGGGVFLGSYEGSGGLTVQGGSTLQLRDSGLFAYSGGLTVTGGTLVLRGSFGQGGEKPLGSGSLTVHDATLNLIVGNFAYTHGNAVAMSGNLSITNSSISGGSPGRDQTFGTLAISGSGTLAVTATGTNDASIIFGATTLSGSPTFDVGSRAGNGLQLGAIGESGGARGITKTGIGTLRLTGASSYTGATTISDGTLALGSGGSLAGSSGITVAAGAVLDASAATAGLAVAANQSLGGAGLILGSVSFGSDSKLAFTSSLTIDSGTVAFNGFGVDDIVGLDGTVVSAGTYPLLGGTATFDLSAALNVGLANAADIGGGQTAYFDGAGLQVIVVPEPALLPLLIAAAASGLIVRRRLPSTLIP